MTEGDIKYTPRWHVRLTDEPMREEVALIVVSEWVFPSGGGEWCVEYLDRDTNEMDDDACFDTGAEARAHAEAEFDFGEDAWQPGFPDPYP